MPSWNNDNYASNNVTMTAYGQAPFVMPMPIGLKQTG